MTTGRLMRARRSPLPLPAQAPQPERPPMQPRAPRLGREEAREEEEEPPAAAEADAPGEKPPHRARLAAVERQEEQPRHAHRQVGSLDRARTHLTPLVRDAHRPRATPLARQ